MGNVKAVRSLYNQTVGGLKEAKDFAETASEKKPVLVASGLNLYQLYVNVAQLDAVNAIYIIYFQGNKCQQTRIPTLCELRDYLSIIDPLHIG